MRALTAVVVSGLVLAGAARGAVDSIVYDQATEWREFRSEGPSVCFTVQGSILWQATEHKVTSVNTARKAASTTLSTLGSISSAGARAMATDSQGTVWIGTGDGLAMGKGTSWQVFTKESGLPASKINALCPTQEGRMWVGTDEGLAMWDRGAWKVWTKGKELRGNEVKTITTDHRGGVWVGTNMGISVLYNGAWTSHSMDNGMSWNDTRALAYDERKQVMWAAVGSADVNCYDGKAWMVYTGVQEGIVCIMVDTQSRVWLGTSAGLMKYNGEEWVTDEAKLGVPAKLVTQMLRDRSGNLWFACEKGVVYLKNPYPF